VYRPTFDRRELKENASELLDAFDRDAGDSNLRWSIGNAMSVVAGDEQFARIAAIIETKSFGKSRQMFVSSLTKMRRMENIVKARQLLTACIDDHEVRLHAIRASGVLRATEARAKLEACLLEEKAWIRKAAKNALQRMERPVPKHLKS